MPGSIIITGKSHLYAGHFFLNQVAN